MAISRGDRGQWLVVLALAMAPAVSNGLARFAYGLILPAMRSERGWSYAEAGWINTANAIGYLLGAVLALRLIGIWGPKRLFLWGMAGMPLALAASALSGDIYWQSAVRILAGVAGAPAFIAGSALASALFADDRRRNALALALFFGGGGLGMLITALSLPPMLDGRPAAWPVAWLWLGGLAALACVPAYLAARATPDFVPDRSGARNPLPLVRMGPELAGYFLFAMGYIVYLTFLIAWLREAGAGPRTVMAVWSIIGLGVMLAPFAWRGILARSRRGGALALANLATGVATLLPIVVGGTVSLYLSATVFGLSFFMGPTAVANFSRANLAPRDWGRGVAIFTIVFGVGQTIGPSLAGAISDRFGGLSTGLAVAGLILLLGAASAVLQRPLD